MRDNTTKVLEEVYKVVRENQVKEIAMNVPAIAPSSSDDELFKKAHLELKSFYANGYLDNAIAIYGEDLVTNAINSCKNIKDVYQLFKVYNLIKNDTSMEAFLQMLKRMPFTPGT